MTNLFVAKRICHVVGDSKFGGGSKIITRLAEAGRDAGHDVCVLASDHTFCKYVEDRGLRTVRLDCIRRTINPVRDLHGVWVLQRHFREAQYDVIHTHTSKAGFSGRLAGRLAGVPRVIHTVHGFAFHEQTPRPLLIAYSLLERLAATWCNHLVTVSNFHRDWALSLNIGNKEKNISIPNGIKEPAGCNAEERLRIRQEFNVQTEQPLVVSAGRLAAGKGLEELLAAMIILRERGSVIPRVLLPGTGPLAVSLLDEVSRLGLQDVVVFPGFRSDIGALLAAADIVVLPSHREGLSIALLEAMATRRPIIATAISSNLEATSGGKCARIVQPGDSFQLAEAIMTLLESPMEAERLAAQGRAIWEERYTEERMLDKYLQLYV
jgi:glycosyltransferase involved in cell wall biosynthesis